MKPHELFFVWWVLIICTIRGLKLFFKKEEMPHVWSLWIIFDYCFISRGWCRRPIMLVFSFLSLRGNWIGRGRGRWKRMRQRQKDSNNRAEMKDALVFPCSQQFWFAFLIRKRERLYKLVFCLHITEMSLFSSQVSLPFGGVYITRCSCLIVNKNLINVSFYQSRSEFDRMGKSKVQLLFDAMFLLFIEHLTHITPH